MSVAEITNVPVIEKGTYFEVTFNLFNPDNSSASLTGISTTYATVRKHSNSISYEQFSSTITGATGTIKLSLTDVQTANLEVGRNYFDVVLTIEGKKKKFLKGTMIVEESMSV